MTGSGGDGAREAADRQLSRRSVLHVALAGGATVAVTGTGALSYRIFDTAVLDPHHGDAFDAWSSWRETPGPLGVVAAGILAANPHNTQPWTFRVTSSGIDVHVDRARRVVALDPFERETNVGLGCAIENMTVAAQVRGLRSSVTLLPDGETGDRVAHVALAAGAPEPTALFDAIGRRHSNRGPLHAAEGRGPDAGAPRRHGGSAGHIGPLGHRRGGHEVDGRAPGRCRHGGHA